MATSSSKELGTSSHHDGLATNDMSGPNGQGTIQHGFETDLEHLPKGYYRSRFFIGSIMATGLGLWAAVASFVSSRTTECHGLLHRHGVLRCLS